MCSNRIEGNWLKRLPSGSGHIDAVVKDVLSVHTAKINVRTMSLKAKGSEMLRDG